MTFNTLEDVMNALKKASSEDDSNVKFTIKTGLFNRKFIKDEIISLCKYNKMDCKLYEKRYFFKNEYIFKITGKAGTLIKLLNYVEKK